AQDGARVLVDRLWPRGLSKEKAALSKWLREVAPSDSLRRWYGHREDLFPEFRRRYLEELSSGEPARALAHLQILAERGDLTLLTSSRALGLSQAAVLQGVLRGAGRVPDEEGGDAACWQRRVCPHCGALAPVEPPTRCPECQQPLPG
ncbi:MAG: DUF488 domain-containing protein, partial [Candidatus Dormibacteria bacterium]